MPVAAAISSDLRVLLSAEKASIRARTRRAPSQPWTAFASGGILTAVALAMRPLLGLSERHYRQAIIITAVYTVYGWTDTWGSCPCRGIRSRPPATRAASETRWNSPTHRPVGIRVSRNR